LEGELFMAKEKDGPWEKIAEEDKDTSDIAIIGACSILLTLSETARREGLYALDNRLIEWEGPNFDYFSPLNYALREVIDGEDYTMIETNLNFLRSKIPFLHKKEIILFDIIKNGVLMIQCGYSSRQIIHRLACILPKYIRDSGDFKKVCQEYDFDWHDHIRTVR
jgi:flagellar motor component MotA